MMNKDEFLFFEMAQIECEYKEMLLEDTFITPEIIEEQKTFASLTFDEKVKFTKQGFGEWEVVTSENFYWQYIREFMDKEGDEKFMEAVGNGINVSEKDIESLEKQVAEATEKYNNLLAEKKAKKEQQQQQSNNIKTEVNTGVDF